MKFLNFFRRKSIHDILDPRTTVKVRGIVFEIRKLNMLDHLHGARILTEHYSVATLENRGTSKEVPPNLGKVKEHFRDVFTQCVTAPKLVRKESDAGPDAIWVDRLFIDWEIADELYKAIIEFTYGKKKIKQILKASGLQNRL